MLRAQMFCQGLRPIIRCFSTSATRLSSLGDGNDGSSEFKTQDQKLKDMIASYQGADHEFEPFREREQASDCIDYHERPMDIQTQYDQPLKLHSADMDYLNAESNREASSRMDFHVDNYDKQGTISLHSVMQSMVPEPFQPSEKNQNPAPSNMPGGQPHQAISLRYTSDKRSGNNDPAGEII